MLIDDRYYFADLVFYHRILKRHVIIELKAHRLDYADTAQLKMYLASMRAANITRNHYFTSFFPLFQ